jgi:UDP-N-acetylglucosamine 2-epimerase
MHVKFATVAGTRPEIIKLSLLLSLLDKEYEHIFIYTDQHYSSSMRDVFFDELGVREPDYSLGVYNSDYSKLEEKIYLCLKKENPSYVLVYGDTNSTVAGAKAAKKVNSKLIHLEAGLRSFDERMPEERNRIYVDRTSNYLLTPTILTKNFLEYEGLHNAYIVGNPIVDVCKSTCSTALRKKTKDRLQLDDDFLLVTVHRQENVDNPHILKKLMKHLSEVEEQCVFPIHPRTKRRLKEYNISLPKNVKATEPLGYFDFLNLLYNCSVVLTDSGGVQEEAITLKKPCITLRETTERWETVILGANVLFPLNRNEKLEEEAKRRLSRSEYVKALETQFNFTLYADKFSLNEVIEEMKEREQHIKSLENPYGETNVTCVIFESIKKIGEKKC